MALSRKRKWGKQRRCCIKFVGLVYYSQNTLVKPPRAFSCLYLFLSNNDMSKHMNVVKTLGSSSCLSHSSVSSNPLLRNQTISKDKLTTGSTNHHQNLILSLLHKCSGFKQVKRIHAIMIRNNLHNDCFLANQVVGICSSFHRMDYAVQVLTQIENPNFYVWNAVLSGFIRSSSPKEAVFYYVDMLKSQVSPTSSTFSSVIKACTQLLDLKFGESVHGQVWKYGFDCQVFVQTSLIDLYSNSGRIDNARQVFYEMPEKDFVSWTTMITGNARVGDMDSARELFDKMPEKNIASWNTMIAGYARSGDLNSAAFLFDRMPEKDLISWTTMISSYTQNKCFKEAVNIFQQMQIARVNPDEVTLAAVISATAHLGALDLGRKIHLYVNENQFDLDVFIGSSLIDMYAKCGSIERSLLVFYKLPAKNLFCWNSMIEGLAMHGYGEDALALFNKMERENIKPNEVTFVSVLSACTHAGLVEEGRLKFSSMIHDYLISPEIRHYGCMVDLLGRAGWLEEAMDLIRSMEMEPNSIVWGALLGGCRIHKNLVVGEVAVKNLLVLEPNTSGYYVLLANMYAEANRWDEVSKIRVMMKGRGVQKSPGCSWIEMEGKVYEFVACDRSHPQSDEIYRLLCELYGLLKLAGYVPDVGFA